MSTFTLFAYRHHDEHGQHDLRRNGLPEWRREDAVAWAFSLGADVVLVQRTAGPASSDHQVTHHVCSDSRCPGGCDN